MALKGLYYSDIAHLSQDDSPRVLIHNPPPPKKKFKKHKKKNKNKKSKN